MKNVLYIFIFVASLLLSPPYLSLAEDEESVQQRWPGAPVREIHQVMVVGVVLWGVAMKVGFS